MTPGDPIRIAVNPSRLFWDISGDGKSGDICQSYSADRIAEGKPIREPFIWTMGYFVCISISGKGLTISGEHEFGAYRLIPARFYKGEATTYAEKTNHDHGESAPADPKGFYNAMKVCCSRGEFVMRGPEVTFVSDGAQRPEDAVQEAAQLSLFS